MRSFRTWSALTAAVVPLALAAACSDPNLRSNLDTSGPPDVTMVSVSSESADYTCDTGDNLGEKATYCSQDADMRVSPGWCPSARDNTGAPIPGNRPADTVMDATPYLWHVRVVFSELLDPSIEELKQDADQPEGILSGHINNTKPFTLTCGGENVAYDGFYDPTGNDLSCPPGPALVVGPTDFTVASGTADCELTINENVTDKDGDAVPAEQRGPYKLGIAPMELFGSAPADQEEGVDPTLPLAVVFNAPVDAATATGNVTLEDDNGVAVTFTAAQASDDPTALLLTPDAPLGANTIYTLTVQAGIKDILGGELSLAEDYTATFMTGTAP